LTIRDFLIALLVPLTWGFGFALAKSGLEHFPPLLLMGMRFGIAALILVWFVPIPRSHLAVLFFIALVSATIQYGLTFSGLARMDATPAILLVQSEVIFGVVIGALLLGEKPNLRQFLGIIIALIGIIILIGGPALSNKVFGIILVLSGCLIWAFGQVLIRKYTSGLTGFQLTAWVGVMASPQMFLASFFVEGNPLPFLEAAPLSAWGTVIYLGIVMTVVGYSAWYYVLGRYPVPVVMPLQMLLPVSTILGAVTFLGERPEPIVFAGGIVVIIGVGVVIIEPSILRKWRQNSLK
jgi:O-acetylserine/cysteine efflux transporter